MFANHFHYCNIIVLSIILKLNLFKFIWFQNINFKILSRTKINIIITFVDQINNCKQ